MIKLYIPRHTISDLVTPDDSIIDNFIAHNKDRFEPVASSEASDIVVLFQKWSFKLPNYKNDLLSDSLFEQHSSKVLVVNYDSTVGQGFLPGCYVSLRKSSRLPNWYRPVCYPKDYNSLVLQSRDSANQPNFLFGFTGTLHSHPIRAALYDALHSSSRGLIVDKTQAFHSHNNEDRLTYVNDLANCKFILCPRGTSPNSYRLFEAMSFGRVPVIVSDDWVPIADIEWSSFSIRVPEKDIVNVEKILTDNESQWEKMAQRALEVWDQHFSESKKNQFYFDQLLELYKLDDRPSSILDYKRMWQSHVFLKNNEWLLSQKISRKLSLILKTLGIAR